MEEVYECRGSLRSGMPEPPGGDREASEQASERKGFLSWDPNLLAKGKETVMTDGAEGAIAPNLNTCTGPEGQISIYYRTYSPLFPDLACL